jgi:hypothetical protein
MYLIFAWKEYEASGGLHDLYTTCDSPLEVIDNVRKAFREDVPFMGTYDYVQIGLMTFASISSIMTIKRDEFKSMLSPHGKMKTFLESVACSHCKEMPGTCTCAIVFDPAQGGYVGRYWEVEGNV